MYTHILRSGFISINKFRFYVKLIGKSICTEIAFLNALPWLAFQYFHFDLCAGKGGKMFNEFNSFKIPCIFY